MFRSAYLVEVSIVEKLALAPLSASEPEHAQAVRYQRAKETSIEFDIDGQRKGNLSRLINHSCSPNLKAFIWFATDGTIHVALFAIRDIEEMTELTMDYNWATDDASELETCLCGNSIIGFDTLDLFIFFTINIYIFVFMKSRFRQLSRDYSKVN